MLLAKVRGDPNVIMIEGMEGTQGAFWLFKRPPLMRAAVAKKKLFAVYALLAIGTDPFVKQLSSNPEISPAKALGKAGPVGCL